MTVSIVLASASEGRSDLLRRTGIPFLVDPSNCSETTDAHDPETHVRILALRKATEVSLRRPYDIVIGADTVIDLDGQMLGKPTSPADAEAMLKKLVGRTHRLVSGIAILHGASEKMYQGVESTAVHLRFLSREQIRAYVASGEPIGKSGSYEIQGLGATIIDRIEGDFANVVGLPLAHLARALQEFGVRVP